MLECSTLKLQFNAFLQTRKKYTKEWTETSKQTLQQCSQFVNSCFSNWSSKNIKRISTIFIERSHKKIFNFIFVNKNIKSDGKKMLSGTLTTFI